MSIDFWGVFNVLLQSARFVIDKFDWKANEEFCTVNITTWREADGDLVFNYSMSQCCDFEKQIVRQIWGSS